MYGCARSRDDEVEEEGEKRNIYILVQHGDACFHRTMKWFGTGGNDVEFTRSLCSCRQIPHFASIHLTPPSRGRYVRK